MVSQECKPNYRTFRVLMKGLVNESRLLFEKAACQHEATVDFCSVDEKELTFANLLVRMSDYGSEPTAETYSTIIVGLCKEGKITEAVKLFHDMEEKSINPDRHIYASLIAIHCSNHKVDTALEFYNLMTLKGFEPHIQSYKTLINALCKDGRCSKASELFENMLDRQLDADEIVWTILIDGLLKDAEIDACIHFVGIMELKNRKANVETYVMLSKELAKELSAADERLSKEVAKESSAADENYIVKLSTPK
ncbi:pentatricopeptide repeat-containing protein [Tanacetum coccineum]